MTYVVKRYPLQKILQRVERCFQKILQRVERVLPPLLKNERKGHVEEMECTLLPQCKSR